MAAQEIIPGRGTELAFVPPSPMALLQMALSQNLDIERLKQFMDLAERWERNEAHKAYTEAMTAFKGEPITLTKDKYNKQYDSWYTSLGNLVKTITPYLSKHGLSHSWDVDQASGIRVTCILRHVMNHSESVSMTVPPDGSGAKNPIQQIKSAITYAKECTLESICGLSATDASLEDDGNGAGKSNGAPHQRVEDIGERVEYIKNARNEDELDRLFKQHYAVASTVHDADAQKKLIAAKDWRKKAIREGR